jgi:U2 small nuclear ribonucleoprotein A'
MRLTPDVVAEAPQRLNCVGARELILRDLAIPAVENLATARDGFDLIDLSANAIAALGPECFPPFPRLTTLYVGSNRIRSIHRGLADSLRNLETLVLTGNLIESIDDLNVAELARFERLHTLSYLDNPVAADESLRLLLVHRIPTLRFINFARVTREERQAAVDAHGPAPVSESRKDKAKSKRKKGKKHLTANTFTVGSLGEDVEGEGAPKRARRGGEKAKDTPRLSKELIDAVKVAIADAKSIDEVVELQRALQSGDLAAIRRLLQ